MPRLRLLSRNRRTAPHYRRQTVGLLLPSARTIDIVPTPAVVSNTMRERHTSFWGVLRSATEPSSLARSSAESSMDIPVFIPQG